MKTTLKKGDNFKVLLTVFKAKAVFTVSKITKTGKVYTEENSFPYEYFTLDQIVFPIPEKGKPTPKQIAEAKELLKNAGYIFTLWSVNDILSRAEELGIELSEKEAIEIGEALDLNHDANIGINWDSIDTEIEEFAKERA